MNPELLQLQQDIYDCKRCLFWRDVASKGVDFRPEPPALTPGREPGDYRVVSFGINPGWRDSIEKRYEGFRNLYRRPAVQDYLDEIAKVPFGAGPYDPGVAATANTFNQALQLGLPALDGQNVWEHVLWANLSLCPSRGIAERVIGGQPLPCRVLTEEIQNCVDAGYAQRLLRIVKPRLVLFFAATVASVMHPSVLLRRVLSDPAAPGGLETISRPQVAMVRSNGTPVYIDISYTRHDGCHFVFLPHPGYRMNSDRRAEATKWACEMAAGEWPPS